MPSRHSGSSHSSSSRSSFSSSSRSSFSSSRPSSHSSSSHSSWSSGSSWMSNNYRNNRQTYTKPRNNFRVVYRPRYNQPWGYYSFFNWYRPRPTIYYCVNHNYTYYPESWTSGSKTYEAGYYDENGNHYEEKPFIEKEVNKIYTKCPNCGNVKDYNYMDFYELENCPMCGTRMNIINDDDDIFIREEEYETTWDKVKRVLFYICLGILIFGIIYLPFRIVKNALNTTNSFSTQQTTNYNQQQVKIGNTIYLRRVSSGYKLVNSSDSYDKKLVKDSDDNYYDETTGLYLYYSKEYDVWQYWYEPISGNFGDYGWMEYDIDEKQWYIEVDSNNWIVVPSNFDTSDLYWIAQ